MSDLSAANCGCNNNDGRNSGFFGNNLIWIILLLSCFGNGNGLSLANDNGNSSCDWLIWILLISCFCGNSCNN